MKIKKSSFSPTDLRGPEFHIFQNFSWSLSITKGISEICLLERE